MTGGQERRRRRSGQTELAGVITIVDGTGTTLLIERLPNARDGAVDLADGRARTAATFRRPTQELHDQLMASNCLGRKWLAQWTMRGVTLLGGGLPILSGTQIIGGIGVSGVTKDDDAKVAEVRVAVLWRSLKLTAVLPHGTRPCRRFMATFTIIRLSSCRTLRTGLPFNPVTNFSGFVMRDLPSIFALTLSAGWLLVACDGATARPSRGERPAAVAATAVALVAPRVQASVPHGPMLAVISIGSQKLSLYQGGALIAQSPISSGMAGHATPTGVFSIIQKNKWHTSNIYSGAEMPFMQRITWSGIALHAGVVPGYPASHGCIRLPYAFAERLWGMTKLGARVIVAPGEARVTTFEHRNLPAPSFQREHAADLPTAAAGTSVAGAVARWLNPMERAHAEKIRAAHAFSASMVQSREALDEARAASVDVDAATALIKRADAAISAANLRIAEAHRLAEAADVNGTAETKARAEMLEAEAEIEFDRALFDLDEAKAARVAFDTVAFDKAVSARAAEAARDRAERANQLAARGTEPISILVSRKERKVFVRQGFEPIFEADIDIRDGDAPLGTHVLIATEPRDGGSTMRWVAANVPGGAANIEAVERSGRAAVFGPVLKVTRATGEPTATAALDRITLPTEAMDFVAQRLWTGATLILSDHGLGTETGKGTDFVVLTK